MLGGSIPNILRSSMARMWHCSWQPCPHKYRIIRTGGREEEEDEDEEEEEEDGEDNETDADEDEDAEAEDDKDDEERDSL